MTHCSQLDRRLPGQLQALYLVGSLALGDFIAGQSDMDFIAVLDGVMDLQGLATMHAGLAHDFPELDCDGIYLRPGELSAPPGGVGVEARAGRINPSSAAERHPVTWLVLADAGIPLRGPMPDSSWIAADRKAARAHSHQNFTTYWHPWLEQRRQGPTADALLSDEAVVWACLGIARLQATIATGQVPSKSGAGEYALKAFPRHQKIITEALRLRQAGAASPLYTAPQERRRDLIAFMDAVLATPSQLL